MQELVSLINADPDGLVKAELVTVDGLFGNEVYTALTISDICAYLATEINSDKLRIRLTTVPLAIKTFLGINTGYYKDRETTIQVFYKKVSYLHLLLLLYKKFNLNKEVVMMSLKENIKLKVGKHLRTEQVLSQAYQEIGKHILLYHKV